MFNECEPFSKILSIIDVISNHCLCLFSAADCEVNVCLNGGTCVTGTGKDPFICICNEGFTGQICNETEIGNNLIIYLYLCGGNSSFKTIYVQRLLVSISAEASLFSHDLCSQGPAALTLVKTTVSVRSSPTPSEEMSSENTYASVQ